MSADPFAASEAYVEEARERLSALSGLVDAQLTAKPRSVVEIDEITASPMRQGHGSRALAILTELADAQGVTLVLEIEADGRETDGLPSVEDLAALYERFGFEEHGMASRIKMRREPA